MLPKSIKLWVQSVNSAKKVANKSQPAYGFVSGPILKKSLQIYCAKMSVR